MILVLVEVRESERWLLLLRWRREEGGTDRLSSRGRLRSLGEEGEVRLDWIRV